MHDVAYLTVGQDKKSWVLPGDYQIAGITIDNPSGSWLLIPEDNTYVPPYTLDFAHSFAPTLSRVNVQFVAGPAGQLSTLKGDRPFCQIYDRPVGESAGVASSSGDTFVTVATPTINLLDFNTSVGLPIVLVAAQANRIMRLYSFEIKSSIDPVVSIHDMGFQWFLQYDPIPFPPPVQGTVFANGVVSPESGRKDSVHFDTNPRDIPLDFAIALLVESQWTTGPNTPRTSFRYDLRYSII